MAETAQFTIGSEASCSDGPCGTVTRVVLDPIAQELTHLVVEPADGDFLGRLVPLSLVDASTGEVRLRCSIAEFGELDPAEKTRFVPGTLGYAAYDPQYVLAWPYYGLGVAGVGLPGEPISSPLIYDAVPLGEVAVRRGEHVHATDGDIGKVQGLVIDRSSRQVTHVLLQEGHLWGRKEVAIPIGAVAGADDGIRLKITKQDVQDLPPVDVDRPD
jgi:sporulation protein YlmC with PRC-barrel domain